MFGSRLTKGLVALLLFPTAVSFLWACVRVFFTVAFCPLASLYFLTGFFIFLVLQALFFNFFWVYVFGHELTHALAGWLIGARLHRISISSTCGEVSLSKTNAFVALAPYCFPLYAVLILLLYAALRWKMDLSPYHAYFLFVMGAALSFHIGLTAYALWTRQQRDLVQAGGVFFSWTAILLVNSLVLVILLKLLFPGLVSLKEFFGETWSVTGWLWGKADHFAGWVLRRLDELIR